SPSLRFNFELRRFYPPNRARAFYLGGGSSSVDNSFLKFGGTTWERTRPREDSCPDSLDPKRATGRLEPRRHCRIHERLRPVKIDNLALGRCSKTRLGNGPGPLQVEIPG